MTYITTVIETNQKGKKMTHNEAMIIIQDAVTYSVLRSGQSKKMAAKNFNSAIGCFAELNGWTKENAASEFIKLCLAGAAKYKASHSYMLKEANDASNIALYVDMQAGQDIVDQRKAGRRV